jgi:cell division septum initiation protein DivIVA
MKRLNGRALGILREALEKDNRGDVGERVVRKLLLQKLQGLTKQEGTPLNESHLKRVIHADYPPFPVAVIQRAAKANNPSKARTLAVGLAATVVGGAGIVGFVALANLPYPMIRRPIAEHAPILLLPSFLSMDKNYREAIALVEQSDQLVNQATSAADLELGQEKVTQAQHHLDQLPVWFLGYYPQRYCTFFGCSWNFTYDEFETARKAIGRMDVVLFQEKNAHDELEEVLGELQSARSQYREAATYQGAQNALDTWQAAIDRLHLIPSQTLAGELARTHMTAANRDLQQAQRSLNGN